MRRLLTLAAVIVLASTAPTLADHVMSSTAAREAALARAVTVVDVRLPVEWSETGLPEGATGIPLQDPLTPGVRSDFVDDLLAAVGGDRNAPLALVCARGARSAYARRLLEEAGFTAVHDIGEGMLGSAHGPGWLARGLPVQPCATC